MIVLLLRLDIQVDFFDFEQCSIVYQIIRITMKIDLSWIYLIEMEITTGN